MKTAILSNMSHELRTPMHQIIGLAQMAQRKATDERQQKSLAHLLEASARLMQLIEKLLSLAQLESGRLKIEAQSFDPRALLQAVLERAQIVATNKGLQLLVEPDANLPTLLRGDAQRISEVLDYLVDNAVKFSASGTISIRAQLLEPQTTLKKVRFEVRDQGIGIRAEDQAQLFESFSQVDDSHRRQFGGAGLGLALSKRLVDLMGGQLGVESTPGSGSTFWVVLSFPHSESALS
jgi:signal transduction histidine kinase